MPKTDEGSTFLGSEQKDRAHHPDTAGPPTASARQIGRVTSWHHEAIQLVAVARPLKRAGRRIHRTVVEQPQQRAG